MEPSLIHRNYKIRINNGDISRKTRLKPALLSGALILLIALFYMNRTNSASKTELTQYAPNNPNVVSIGLPENSTDGFTAPALARHISSTASANSNTLQAKSKINSNEVIWKNYTVKYGDSLAKIFAQLKYSATTLHKIIQLGDKTESLKNIRPGQTLRFAQNSREECVAIEYNIDRIKTLNIRSSANGFNSFIAEKPVEISHSTISTEINSSLFYDAKKAGLSDKTIMELANIFGWDIDFSQGLRQGDSFTLLFESQYIDDQRIENGKILAAEFINRGNKYRAVRFENKSGNAEYFSPDGKSIRKTFLRNPIDFARVSSRFNLRRKHPALNRIRAHKGVDYAASKGTPIKSTGDGKVIFRGMKGGYGRVVIVKHGQKYSSLYAHMSKYGRYKKGSRVKQGQIVGYVGRSGLATGSHLHYELRINGVHRNPLTAKLPAAKPIDKKLLAQFKQQTSPLLAKLELAKKTQLALID